MPTRIGSASYSPQTLSGSTLVGVYLYGSTVCGAFVPSSSDVDVVVVHRSDLPHEKVLSLAALHEHLVRERPAVSRFDASFAPLRLVGAGGDESPPYFRNGLFHQSGGGDVNLVLWRGLQERGVAVWGRPVTQVVPPVTGEDLHAEMRRNLTFLRRRMPVYAASGAEAAVFGVPSIRRVLYTLQTGDLASKPEAARWAPQNVTPRWRGLIRNALERHENGEVGGTAVRFRTLAMAFSRSLTR